MPKGVVTSPDGKTGGRGAQAPSCYSRAMTITLTPEQQKRLEAAVAAGEFASVEEVVRCAVDRMVADDLGDLSWAKPFLDEARASIALGDSITLEEFNADMEKHLQRLEERERRGSR